MNITIKRHRLKKEIIDGQLYIEGLKVCDTAENAITALQAGTYPVVIHKCYQHSRKMLVVLLHKDLCPNCQHCESLDCVSNNTTMPTICHQLCPGNGVHHREDGSIIVGEYIAPGCLKHPKQAFDTLYERIRKNAQRGHELTLEIIENYPIARREPSNFELGNLILKQF